MSEIDPYSKSNARAHWGLNDDNGGHAYAYFNQKRGQGALGRSNPNRALQDDFEVWDPSAMINEVETNHKRTVGHF